MKFVRQPPRKLEYLALSVIRESIQKLASKLLRSRNCSKAARRMGILKIQEIEDLQKYFMIMPGIVQERLLRDLMSNELWDLEEFPFTDDSTTTEEDFDEMMGEEENREGLRILGDTVEEFIIEDGGEVMLEEDRVIEPMVIEENKEETQVNNLCFFTEEAGDNQTILFYPRFIIEQMLKIFFTNRLTYLTLGNKEMDVFHKFLCNNAYKLTGLTNLKLETELPHTKNSNMESNIIIFLKQLKNLRRLSMANCTNRIVQCVAVNCRKIENLELRNHKSLTIETVNSLVELPNLKNVDLYDAEYDIADTFYMTCDEIENRKQTLLEHIVSLKQFQLKSFQQHIENTPQLMELAVINYPQIKHLTLMGKVTGPSVAKFFHCIKEMPCLQTIEFDSLMFYSQNVKDLLDGVGRKLSSIKFEACDQIDFNAVKYLSLVCPFLRHLCISNSPFVDKPLPREKIPSNMVIPPFKHLKEISVTNGVQTLDLDVKITLFLVANSPNVEVIDISETYLTENDMIELFDKNSLRRLKYLNMSGEQSEKVQNQIIENCKFASILWDYDAEFVDEEENEGFEGFDGFQDYEDQEDPVADVPEEQ